MSDTFLKVPRYVLKELLAQFYGVGTQNIIFLKYSIEVVNPLKNVPENKTDEDKADE